MTTPTLCVDHLVLVTTTVEETLDFYERVLGAEVRDRHAWQRGAVEYPVLHFGSFKLNVHPADTHASPRAAIPAAGALDVALRWSGDVASAERHLRSHDVDILLAPLPKKGHRGSRERLRSRLGRRADELICYPSDSPPMTSDERRPRRSR
jgi:catechol 2,3-dioxygenase-like lactoylglutathione lyase family enzyme